jgi:hypothetical protein
MRPVYQNLNAATREVPSDYDRLTDSRVKSEPSARTGYELIQDVLEQTVSTGIIGESINRSSARDETVRIRANNETEVEPACQKTDSKYQKLNTSLREVPLEYDRLVKVQVRNAADESYQSDVQAGVA